MADLDKAFQLFSHDGITRDTIDKDSNYHKQNNNEFNNLVPMFETDDYKLNIDYGNKEEFQNIVEYFNNIMMSKVMNTNCYSPCSIMYIMLMVYLGSTEDTHDKIREILKINVDDNILFNSLVKIQKILQPSNSVNMDLSNGMFVNSGLISHVESEYKKLFSQIGIISGEDFSDSQSTASKINNWISNKTHGLIRNLIDPNSISTYTLMVLVNTLYFKSKWKYEFDKSNTRDANFRTSKDQIKSIKLMNADNSYLYYENEDLQLIEIPYINQDYVMRVLLPRYNVRKVRTNITELSSRLQKEKVMLYLPKFKIDISIGLVPIFKNIGLQILFDHNNASFKGILNNDKLPNLYIDNIIHQSVIIVDEEGTEAAAATAITMVLNCSSPPKIKKYVFRADHTFQYQILHKPTQTILFNGVYDG